MLKSQSLSLEEIQAIWVPYRVAAVQNAAWALDLMAQVSTEVSVQATIAGKIHLEGDLALFLNPIIESGFMHARALLEFLGLAVKNGKLITVARRQPSDVAIEHYCWHDKQLPKVSPDEVFDAINMPRIVVEWALVGIVENTNKLLAHVTTGEVLSMAMLGQIQVALEGMPALIGRYFYARLGLSPEANIGNAHWRNSRGMVHEVQR
ncbi:hypothetical protein J2X19_003335 [Rhodoferax ferrireducens]|uniref:Uncharacterized protein n=1 Tax=Rhodoferax ferrireducens TaxID=192843 RepID=A0ABU2CBG1_9BURK|nr:hypothetical protein [Rhodoferax ferrireducens]MDR7378641.1 hypothetical protein [Rhodoferax ferrireducens]